MRSKRTDNRQLPHLWASGNVPRAHNSTQSFWFEGDTIYSYRQPIGVKTNVRVPDSDKRVVLLSSLRWSVTTSRHQRMASYALDDARWYRFCVPRLDVNLKSRSDANGAHTANANYLFDQFQEVWERLERGRHTPFDWILNNATGALETYNTYLRTFLRRRPLKVLTEDQQETLRTYRERCEAWEAEYEERQRIRAAKLIQEAQEDLQKWLNGEAIPRWHFPTGMGVYLRMVEDNGELVVETTMGVKVPESHAKRVWKFLLNLKARGETYQHNGHTVPIGNFTVDRIDENYTLHAGCHHIPFERMQEFALKYWKEEGKDEA